MRRLIPLILVIVLPGCQAPMPAADPQMAWVDLSLPFPNDRVLLAERLDKKRLDEGRFFQVAPGRHELVVRFDYEVNAGAGLGMMGTTVRQCYLTLDYAHFQAGQRYMLEARSMALSPEARLYNAERQVVAALSDFYCLM
ncbi:MULTISPECIES: hypothetical protein [unclassified Pseudomonas]|uniref:PA0061/PA0062 family lipoprotein n=1 Tax=unclassified Pseudomonas TaxID=196821 RepID=UPI0035C062B6